MTKQEFIRAIKDRTSIAPTMIAAVIDTIPEVLNDLTVGEDLTLRNFISVKKVSVPPRKGFNPHTKESIYIPAKIKLKITSKIK